MSDNGENSVSSNCLTQGLFYKNTKKKICIKEGFNTYDSLGINQTSDTGQSINNDIDYK